MDRDKRATLRIAFAAIGVVIGVAVAFVTGCQAPSGPGAARISRLESRIQHMNVVLESLSNQVESLEKELQTLKSGNDFPRQAHDSAPGSSGSSEVGGFQRRENASETASSQHDIENALSVMEIAELYRKNVVAADAQFIGKKVVVKGHVKGIFWWMGATIGLGHNDFTVQCVFSTEQEHRLMDAELDGFVVVSGFGYRSKHDYPPNFLRLDDCDVLFSKPKPQ